MQLPKFMSKFSYLCIPLKTSINLPSFTQIQSFLGQQKANIGGQESLHLIWNTNYTFKSEIMHYLVAVIFCTIFSNILP